MKSLPKVTFIIDDFKVGTPGQQLLDRFLIGYNRSGEFHSPGCAVELFQGKQSDDAIAARVKDFGLKIGSELNQAEAVVFVGPVQNHLETLPRRARCFVYGTIAETGLRARELVKIANQREIALRAQTAVSGAFQLPVIEIPGKAFKAVAVTFGRFPDAELEALEGLWKFGEPGQPNPTVKSLTGADVWKAAYSSEWADLFGAAFSRSNTIQGDPEKDGRTQDVAGLRLVEKLVKDPRGWLIEDPNGARMAVFVMNGALEDLNVAFETPGGKIISTQLYRPPPPMQDHFSVLAGQIEDFFRQDTQPNQTTSLMTLPGILDLMGAARQRQG
jgi:hypothetical protein